jgi:uncharacterized protein YceH (UPF0502 family)
VDLTDPEIRVLGCLVEKQRLTPDAYPLSLNSLRLAANQSTSRDPVVDYDEDTVRDALARLYRRRWARLASTSGRASKYRHLLDEALGLPDGQLALLTVLMLRGIQTPGELRARSERMHRFADASEVQAALDGLAERELIARLDRRPGQKEERYAHRLGEDAPASTLPADEVPPAPAPAPAPQPAAPPLREDERLAQAERDIADLRGELAALREQMAALRAELGD